MSNKTLSKTPYEIEFHNGAQKISVPRKKLGAVRYLYILGQIGALVFGGFFFMTIREWNYESADPTIYFGLLLFLCFFYVIGLNILYRLVRNSEPEVFLLDSPYMSYDTGVPHLELTGKEDVESKKKMFKSMFYRRKKYQFTPEEIKTLELHDTYAGNLLTIDRSDKRLYLAADASEHDRKWLFQHLKQQYNV